MTSKAVKYFVLIGIMATFLMGPGNTADAETKFVSSEWPFRGIHLSAPGQKDIEIFKKLISEVLPSYGCNTLIIEVGYRYDFKSHPELSTGKPLTLKQASEIANVCKKNGIRIIPLINLFGHQSWGNPPSNLLRVYPEFDETPDRDTISYCRSLCPRHPKVKGVVFDLIDELIEAFDADAFHVGFDEVFIIGECPNCIDSSNAELFAEWVNRLHGHIVGEKGVEMFMWGDRLLKPGIMNNSKYEASTNNIWPAVDKIPKDIIICDWHYSAYACYPSVPFIISKGFQVIICPWKEPKATELFLRFAAKNKNKKLIGVLATTWCNSGEVARYLCNGDTNVSETARLAGESFKSAMKFEE
jgi:hypothetical protein